MTYPAINASKSSHSFAVAELFDVDGIKTAFATSTSASQVLPAAMTGAAMVSGTGRFAKSVARTVTLTLAAQVGAYATDPITLTYKRNGTTYTAAVTPPDADGGVTLRFADASGRIVLADELVSVDFPEQDDTDGSFQLGVEDIGPKGGDRWHACELHAAGNLTVEYPGGHQDTIPLGANALRVIGPERIVTNQSHATPTNVGVTGYWG